MYENRTPSVNFKYQTLEEILKDPPALGEQRFCTDTFEFVGVSTHSDRLVFLSEGVTRPGSSLSLTNFDFDAIQDQDTFDAVYSPGAILVFVNGIKLRENEYTALNGYNVKLHQAMDLDDWVNISVIN